MARSGRFFSRRDRITDESKTALEALRQDIDATKNSCVLMFWAATTNVSAVRNMYPFYEDAAASATNLFVPLPFDCTIKRLEVGWITAGTVAGQTITFTVVLNGELTSLKVEKDAADTTTHSHAEYDVRCKAGDRIRISMTPEPITVSPQQIAASLHLEVH